MKNKRILYLDELRIFATFSMILLHVCSSKWYLVPVNTYEWQIINAYDCLVRFCVPVFLMISGVLFLDPNKKIGIKHLYKHNILRIVTAFAFWSFAYLCFNASIQVILKNVSISKIFNVSLLEDFLYGNYHMWFIFIILGLYIMIPILKKITEEEKTIKYFIILAFIFCYFTNLLKYIPNVGYKLFSFIGSLNINSIGYAGYFVLGYYLNKYDLSSKTKKLLYILGIISLISTILFTSIYSLTLGKANFILMDYLLPNTFFISIAVFILFKDKVSKIKLNKPTILKIQNLSSLTFGIYLIHDFFITIFKKIGLTPLSFNPLLSIPIITLIVFLCSQMIIYIISKIPILKKYII